MRRLCKAALACESLGQRLETNEEIGCLNNNCYNINENTMMIDVRKMTIPIKQKADVK